MMFKEQKIQFKQESISCEHGTIMHKWETPIMQHMVNFICSNGGDILELGFGMGISAEMIQKQIINSHTICEIHLDIIPNLKKWSKSKSVKVLEGSWYENRDQLKKYDGIFFDTHLDPHHHLFKKLVPKICNPGCRITWWNNSPFEWNEHKLPETEFEVIHVNPPKNDYFNHKEFYMPKYIHNG